MRRAAPPPAAQRRVVGLGPARKQIPELAVGQVQESLEAPTASSSVIRSPRASRNRARTRSFSSRPRRQRQRRRLNRVASTSRPFTGIAALHGALDHDFLDLADGFRRVQSFRAHIDAVHDRVAAEQPIRVLEIVEALARRIVARVGDEAVGGKQARPGRRTCRGSTRTTGRRSSSTRTGCIRRGRRAPRDRPATAAAPFPAAACR